MVYPYKKLTLREKGIVTLIIVPAAILMAVIIIKTMFSKRGDASA